MVVGWNIHPPGAPGSVVELIRSALRISALGPGRPHGQGMSGIIPPLAELCAPIEPGLDRVAAILADELRSDLPCVNELCIRIHGARGKMLRPALLLLSGEACGKITDQHYVLGAVVEMVHLATLVHDDVLDEADVRRSRPTVNASHGNEAAVMLGDYLISHAFHLCSGLDTQFASRLIGRTTNVICEGELLQIHRRGSAGLTEEEYLDIIRRKTAALTGACCGLGAVFADAEPGLVAALESYGRNCGVAFQIIDDILDLVGKEQRVGKTLGRDLALGKLTLPIIHHLGSSAPGRAGDLLQIMARNGSGVRARITAALSETSSVDYALDRARRFVERAQTDLQTVAPGPARDCLAAMAEFILQREQ